MKNSRKCLAVIAIAIGACYSQADKSTPENAAKSFASARGMQTEADIIMNAVSFFQAQHKVETGYLTPERLKARGDEIEKLRSMVASAKKENYKLEDFASTQKSDGFTFVSFTEKATIKGKHPDTGKEFSEDIKDKCGYLLKKSGVEWAIAEMYKGCHSCDGQGQCRSCNGTGVTMNGEKEEKCYSCHGKKVCERCNGEKFTVDEFDYGPLEEMTWTDEDYKISDDLSTAKSAALTMTKVRLKQHLEICKWFLNYLNGQIAALQKFGTPELIKKLKDKLSTAVENGKTRFKNLKLDVVSIKETSSDSARAVVTDVMGRHDGKLTVILKKVSEKWLADHLGFACYSCSGGGECSDCKGTGKMFDKDCYSCNGEKKCRSCKGEGFQEENPAR